MHTENYSQAVETELTSVGFTALKTAKDVADHFTHQMTGNTLLVINSMCGCAGPDARSAVIRALEVIRKGSQPTHLVTVLAGVDLEATTQVQAYIKPYLLSSPAVALIGDGEVLHFVERHQIKGQPIELLAEAFATILEEHN